MNKPRYNNPLAFKSALESRLRRAGGATWTRERQLLIFYRFLARLDQTFGEELTLKGGLVLELRLERARTTKDIDVRLIGSPDGVLDRLQEAGRLDLDDYLNFEVSVDAKHPDIKGDGVKYDGFRYKAECKLAVRDSAIHLV